MTGIYRIKNMITGKCYVGQSKIDIEGRWKTHIRELRNNKHLNNKLQNTWNKYGEENFIFGVIEECEVEQCNEMERYWIAYYDSFHNGYNNTEGGEGISGWNHSEETRKKISEHNAAKNNPETRKKMSDNHAFKGKHLSEKHRQKISESFIGKKNPMYIPRTSEMISDVKNNMNYKDFCVKYSVSTTIYYKIKKELRGA